MRSVKVEFDRLTAGRGGLCRMFLRKRRRWVSPRSQVSSDKKQLEVRIQSERKRRKEPAGLPESGRCGSPDTFWSPSWEGGGTNGWRGAFDGGCGGMLQAMSIRSSPESPESPLRSSMAGTVGVVVFGAPRSDARHYSFPVTVKSISLVYNVQNTRLETLTYHFH